MWPFSRKPTPEPVVQTLRDLCQRQGAYPCCGKLDGQRHAVEAATNLGYQARVVADDTEGRPRVLSAVDEQLDCLVFQAQ